VISYLANNKTTTKIKVIRYNAIIHIYGALSCWYDGLVFFGLLVVLLYDLFSVEMP